MKRIQAVLLCICVVSIAVIGCQGGAQIYQVKEAPVQRATGKQPSLEDVQKAIMGAGAGLNWKMTITKPGEIIGVFNIRSHQAIVSIPYTTKNYSIIYKDSTNLKYDAEKQTIHENYSVWIQRLDGAIRAQLLAAGL